MKKKFIKDTYLLGVEDYDINVIKDDKYGAYISAKHIKDIDKPYIETHSGKNVCLLDNGYYILEYLPVDENYVVRVFLNDKKEIQEYYIDVTKENGYENNTPYYLDLYLDVTIDVHNDNKVIVWDENELEKAVDDNDVSKEEYNMAYGTLRNLLDEISNHSNKFINNNHEEMLNNILNV